MSARQQWPIATEHLQRGVPGLRYPRTLGEAFKDTADYACAVEVHDVSAMLDWFWLDALVAVLFVGLVVALAWSTP